MIRSLWTASTGMLAQQLNLDVISNNLANVNTNGFKKSRVDFQDLIYQTLKPAGTTQIEGSQIPIPEQIGLGTKVIGTQKMFTMGELKSTGNPLDLAIEGEGFFQIMTASGEMGYTRDGSFKMDRDGRLVNSSGFLLQPEIVIPPETLEVTVGMDGTVSIVIPNQIESQAVGQIQLYRFPNPAGLSSGGNNTFFQTSSSGDPVAGIPSREGFGAIANNLLELSNVQVVEEMVSMIVAQRAYEINSKAIQTADQMLQIANNLRG